MIVYLITLCTCTQANLVPIIKLFSMVYNHEYTNFDINIAMIFHELLNDKYLADVTLNGTQNNTYLKYYTINALPVRRHSLMPILYRHMK